MNEQNIQHLLDGDLNIDADVADIFDTPAASETLGNTAAAQASRDLGFFRQIPVTVTLEVASTDIALGELLTVGPNSVIELDKLNGEPLDVKVNGRLLGHAEVVVVNDKYGLRLTDIAEDALHDVTA
ncbi:flagellar motor switch protein FliN [Photobacterium gaetbulicola]|uniref:Flagellar motor switch protein FliN n=2 Tax=Photobacterium gaetbulicola TaxID=1295392 RepID=A0A0C5WRU2_9GAMM|nr:flagellar motor switch protein FliN [Photobacterium gaetbulicola]AJR07779.1 flagellar motor switch protein [Photobacterium gaetbulicola Gung47]KHT62917.1 flagellar motor switch protein FliN [Photobacterium gaetbulicola]PSU03424.1 flagellar motor switch protein FliN [Photobacterium gaetbulicola]